MKFPAFNRLWIDAIRFHVKGLPNQRVKITDSRIPILQPGQKRAAVLVSLCNRHGVPSVLFTQRSETLSTHKGQVSFPGGHLEPDEDPVQAAIRETNEELGEGVGDIEVIGLCQTLPAITGTLVTPVIGFIHKDVEDFEHLYPNFDEVDHVFTRSLEELSAPGYKTTQTFERNGMSYHLPVYGEGPERIWGFTAVVLESVLDSAVLASLPDPELMTLYDQNTW